VLATDMKQHFNILSHFTTVHRINTSGALSPSVTSSVDPAHRVRARYGGEGVGAACSCLEGGTDEGTWGAVCVWHWEGRACAGCGYWFQPMVFHTAPHS
jgi:hypothetical protein